MADQNEPSCGIGLIQSWTKGKSITLRRIGTSGVALTSEWTADAKLTWLLSNDMIFLAALYAKYRRS